MKFKPIPFIPLMVFAILLSVAGTACDSPDLESLVIFGILDPCEDTVPDPSGGGEAKLLSTGRLDLAVQQYTGNSGYEGYVWLANMAVSSMNEAMNQDEGNRIMLDKASVSFIVPSTWTKLSGFTHKLNLVMSPEMSAGLRIPLLNASVLDEIREIYQTRSYLTEQQLAFSDEVLYMDYDDYREIFEDLYVLCESLQQDACMAAVLQAKLISDIEPLIEDINTLSGGAAASIVTKVAALREKVDSLKNGQTACHPQTAIWDCNGFACEMPLGYDSTQLADLSTKSFPADLNDPTIVRPGFCRPDCSVLSGCSNVCYDISTSDVEAWNYRNILNNTWTSYLRSMEVKSCDYGPQDNGVCRTSCLQGSVECEPFLHPISGEVILDYDCYGTICSPKTADLNPHRVETLIAKIKIFGTRMDGSGTATNSFLYPIEICKGCLLMQDYDRCGEAAATIKQYYTDNYNSECVIKDQDFAVFCEWLTGCESQFCP